MNIILFTPALKASAIGRMANLVSCALISHGHQVTVVRTESTRLLESITHDFGPELIPWNDFAQVENLAEAADAFIYQIGNNYDFHQGCLEWLPKLPGIICLHDFFLGHLFNGWAQGRRHQADAELRAWYGNEIAGRFFSYQNSEAFIEGVRNVSPMTEWVCSMAHGVITHSSWGLDRVLKSCPGPVCVTPLAYDAPKIILSDSDPKSPACNQFNILTIGHINPNKRVASMIQAIGNSSLLRRHSTTYRLVGNIQPEVVIELSNLARKHQVNLVISGEVSDATLAYAIKEADVISCLRWPSLEAASASVIEAMLYGKPVVVTDVGCYSELPDECVCKVRLENEIGDLQTVLEFLYKNEHERVALSGKAAKWASVTFSPDKYAQRLIEVVLSTMKTNPTVNAVNYFVRLMHGWGAEASLPNDRHIIGPLDIFQIET